MTMKTFAFLTITGTALLASAPAISRTAVSIPDVIAKAESAWGGHAISVEMETGRKGRLAYEVALLQGDTVRTGRIDAFTGEPMQQSKALVDTYRLRLLDRSTLQEARNAKQLGAILKRLEARTNGRVIEASFEVEAGQPRYEVEISTENGVADIYLDPRTGERISLVYDD